MMGKGGNDLTDQNYSVVCMSVCVCVDMDTFHNTRTNEEFSWFLIYF